MRKVRVGRIKYINVLPIYYALENGIIENDYEFFYGTPSELNKMASRGEVDVSSVSSIEYARNFPKYLLVPNIAIGSNGSVKSVILKSKVPPSQLDQKKILVSAQTHTSFALLKMILEKKFNVFPEYMVGNVESLLEEESFSGFLAIGDEALNLRNHPKFPYILDLGEAWQKWTGYPFVFGVWIVNISSIDIFSDKINEVCKNLLKSKDWGNKRIRFFCEKIIKHKVLTKEELISYFNHLSYDLDEKEKKGLVLFYKLLEELNEIPKAPPLNFYNL